MKWSCSWGMCILCTVWEDKCNVRSHVIVKRVFHLNCWHSVLCQVCRHWAVSSVKMLISVSVELVCTAVCSAGQMIKLFVLVDSQVYTAAKWHRSSTVTMTTYVINIGWWVVVKTESSTLFLSPVNTPVNQCHTCQSLSHLSINVTPVNHRHTCQSMSQWHAVHSLFKNCLSWVVSVVQGCDIYQLIKQLIVKN